DGAYPSDSIHGGRARFPLLQRSGPKPEGNSTRSEGALPSLLPHPCQEEEVRLRDARWLFVGLVRQRRDVRFHQEARCADDLYLVRRVESGREEACQGSLAASRRWRFRTAGQNPTCFLV